MVGLPSISPMNPVKKPSNNNNMLAPLGGGMPLQMQFPG
jgi:hypothetical protein